MSEPEINSSDAERAWMVELNRIGTEAGVKGFPTDPEMLVGSCWQADFMEGLTPRESLEGERDDAPPELVRRKRRAELPAMQEAE